MKFSPLAFRFVAFALLFLAGTSPTRAQNTAVKPMGAWFGLYQKTTVDDELAGPLGAGIETHYYSFDSAKLPRYSAVLIGPGSGTKLSEAQNAELEAWVRAGGALLISSGEYQKLWGQQLPDWVAGKGATSWWSRTAVEAAIQQPNHPLVQGLDGLGEKNEWQLQNGLANYTAGVSLMGSDKFPMLFENKLGAGRILGISENLVPAKWPVMRDGQRFTLNLTPLMRRFWTNLLQYLQIPSRSEVIAAWAQRQTEKEPLAVWYRFEEEKPIGGKLYNPPYPGANDSLKNLHFDNGLEENNRRYFFLTTTAELPAFTVTPTDLVSASGARILAANCRIYLQEKPTPDYPKASYWLVDPKYIEPLGSPAVKLAKNETYTYWIVLSTDGGAPEGLYKGTLKFADGNRALKTLPIEVRVWPLQRPPADALHFELEHSWFTLPGGYWIRDAQNNPALLNQYMKALGALGVDVGQSWGDIGKGYNFKFTRLREDGSLLDETLKRDPARFQDKVLPSLSFSGIYDTWWNNAIAAGMSNFAQAWLIDNDISLSLARRIYQKEDIAANSPEHQRIAQWYWGEYNKYLKERGILKTYIKVMDEFGPEKVPEYIRSASVAQAAGFKAYTTAYNLMKDPGAIARMDPYTDMWQLAWPLDNPHDFFNRHHVPFEAGNEIWGTTAGSYWGNYIDYPRGYGWEAARLRMNGLHVHGYMRWKQNESEGAYIGPDGPFDSITVTTYAQSVSEGRYLAQLLRMIDTAKTSGRGAEIARQIEKEIATQVIGLPDGGASPLIPLVTSPVVLGGVEGKNADPQNHLDSAIYAQAKVRVFEMLLRLKKAMGEVKPDVLYGELALIREGKINYTIQGMAYPAASQALAARIAQVSGGKPVLAKQAGEVRIILGTLQDQALQEIVETQLPTEITPHYPPPGTYAIRRLPGNATQPATLLIVGGDGAGVEMGARNLGLLLTTRNKW